MGFEIGDLLHGDLKALIEGIGYIGVFTIVFVESGLLIGFFLPGDSLLFTAGVLAALGVFDIKILILGCFIAAVAGDSVGYYIGHKYGKRLFNKEKSLLFQKDHLLKAQRFYEKHGGKTIILARFMPVIRTFAPVVAGIGDMKYRDFLAYNIIGGVLWAIGLTLAGYFLGSHIPADNFEKILLMIIGGIVILSVAPAAVHILKDGNHRRRIYNKLGFKKAAKK